MDRLSIFLTFMTGSVLVGGFVIVVLALGHYAWWPIAIAVAAGLILTWPVAYAISRWIKRKDPEWRQGRGAGQNRDDQDADHPET